MNSGINSLLVKTFFSFTVPYPIPFTFHLSFIPYTLYLASKNPINLRHPQRKFPHIINKNIIGRTVHMFHVVAGLMVNGDAEGVDVSGLGFKEGMAGVLDGIVALVVVIIFGLAVAEGDEEADFGVNIF